MKNLFDLKASGTNVRTEILAGVTTFATMAYILVVQASFRGLAQTSTALTTRRPSPTGCSCRSRRRRWRHEIRTNQHPP